MMVSDGGTDTPAATMAPPRFHKRACGLEALPIPGKVDVMFPLKPAAGDAAAAEEAEVAAGFVRDIDVPRVARILGQGVSELFERHAP
jgi:hypothetical protein